MEEEKLLFVLRSRTAGAKNRVRVLAYLSAHEELAECRMS
jgi:hypothetical protein